ncbi:MAG: hypothetical protein ACK5C5_03025 [Bacteroidota bacterium]
MQSRVIGFGCSCEIASLAYSATVGDLFTYFPFGGFDLAQPPLMFFLLTFHSVAE